MAGSTAPAPAAVAAAAAAAAAAVVVVPATPAIPAAAVAPLATNSSPASMVVAALALALTVTSTLATTGNPPVAPAPLSRTTKTFTFGTYGIHESKKSDQQITLAILRLEHKGTFAACFQEVLTSTVPQWVRVLKELGWSIHKYRQTVTKDCNLVAWKDSSFAQFLHHHQFESDFLVEYDAENTRGVAGIVLKDLSSGICIYILSAHVPGGTGAKLPRLKALNTEFKTHAQTFAEHFADHFADRVAFVVALGDFNTHMFKGLSTLRKLHEQGFHVNPSPHVKFLSAADDTSRENQRAIATSAICDSESALVRCCNTCDLMPVTPEDAWGYEPDNVLHSDVHRQSYFSITVAFRE